MRARGPLPIGEAVDCVLQIIEGLEAAQRIGILHRDVKPSNCYVGEDGAVKIGDFGLSISTAVRTEPALTATGAFLGTPGVLLARTIARRGTQRPLGHVFGRRHPVLPAHRAHAL